MSPDLKIFHCKKKNSVSDPGPASNGLLDPYQDWKSRSMQTEIVPKYGEKK
jgi:hypothetical protein